MARDLFLEAGIEPPQKSKGRGRDLFLEAGIQPPRKLDALDNQNMAADGLSTSEALLAGAGKRLKDIFTLGLAKGEYDDQLMTRPAAQVGSAVADIAGFALPLAKGAQALSKALPFAASFPAISSIFGNAATAGAFEGLTNTGGVADRAKSAGMAALTAGAIDSGVQGLSKIAKGPLSSSNVTPGAQKLIEEGVPVPPWKASDSQRVRDFVERAKASFIGKPIINDAERRAFLEWNKNFVAKASPPVPVLDDAGNLLRWKKDPIRQIGDDTLNTLKSRFDDAYESLYKGKVIPIDETFKTEVQSNIQAVDRYYPHLSGEVRGIAQKVEDLLSSVKTTTDKSKILDASGKAITNEKMGHAGVTNGAIRSAIDAVDDAITTAYRMGNGEKADALEGLKSALVSARQRGLPPEVQSMVGDINTAYTNFMQLQRAMSSVGAQKAGMTTPQQMLNAIKAGDRTGGKAAFSRGNMPNQSDTLNAARVLGSSLPETGPGTAEKLRLAAIASSPFALSGDLLTAGAIASLASPVGQRFVFGQYPFQPALSAAIRGASPYVSQTGALIREK